MEKNWYHDEKISLIKFFKLYILGAILIWSIMVLSVEAKNIYALIFKIWK